MELNNNFKRNFKTDMDHTVERLDFMKKFGDPLDGLDLRKPIVIWYPTYFMLVRIIFVLGSLLLWNRPLTVISVRILTSLFGFCVISIVRPYEDSKAVTLELMNEATIIFILDIIIFFTNLLSLGDAEDLSQAAY